MKPLLLSIVLLVPTQDPPDLVPGLIGEYFDIGEDLTDFPSVDNRKPKLRKIDKRVAFASTKDEFNRSGLKDFFYVRWMGVLRVPKDGRYRFYTESDDGSRLYVGGKLVVDNGGLHGMHEESAELDLKAGDVEIKIDFFDNTGDAGCRARWESEDISKEVIPEKAFFHKKDKDLDR
jgi:PA14 domain-containing protein